MLQSEKPSPHLTESAPSNAPRRVPLTEALSDKPQYLWIGPKTEIIVFLDQGKPRAFHSICPHMGAKMERCGENLRCPWHGLEFSTKTLASDHHRYKRICEVKVEVQGSDLVVLGNVGTQREVANEN